MDFTYTVETRKDPRRSWIGKRKQGRREEEEGWELKGGGRSLLLFPGELSSSFQWPDVCLVVREKIPRAYMASVRRVEELRSLWKFCLG